jgi:hypothetical protein
VTDNAKKNLDREIQILTRVDHPSTLPCFPCAPIQVILEPSSL